MAILLKMLTAPKFTVIDHLADKYGLLRHEQFGYTRGIWIQFSFVYLFFGCIEQVTVIKHKDFMLFITSDDIYHGFDNVHDLFKYLVVRRVGICRNDTVFWLKLEQLS